MTRLRYMILPSRLFAVSCFTRAIEESDMKFTVCIILLLLYSVACYDVKIGLMTPQDEVGFVKYMYGFSTTAGALTIGIDRIIEEDLLPGANISIIWRFDQCDESTAAGHAIDMILNEKVDVILGPPCSVPAAIVAIICKYYNIPMVSWGATAVDVTELETLPTLSRVIGSSFRIGRALKEILSYFNWTRIAFFYTDDKATRKCYSAAQGAIKHLARGGIHIVLMHEIDGERPTDEEVDRFLDLFPALTRIVLTCIDRDEDNRRFTLRAQQRGLAGEEYVYIIPDYVRDENKTDVWSDRKGLVDGRDAESRKSMENVMFVEMQLESDAKLWKFKSEVVKRTKQAPFNYNSDLANDQFASLYAPFLHDAVYLYGVALNHSLSAGYNLTDGRAVTNYTRNVRFHGMSGHVVIDNVAGREPSFVLKGFGKDGKLTPFLVADMYKHEGSTVRLLVSEEEMWANRNGYAPKWYPKCGFFGELCITDEIKSKRALLPWIIVSACLGGLILLCGFITAIIYYKRRILNNEMQLMLWKIRPNEVTKLVDLFAKQHEGSSSTVRTDISEDVADIVLKGDERCACVRDQVVWLKKLTSSIVLSSKQDHMQLKLLREMVHENVNTFVGLVLEGSSPTSAWRYCSKGSLQDILMNTAIKIDWFFKYSLIRDLTNGLEFIHNSPISSHGTLKSTNCVINNRWVLKITDFGLPGVRMSPDAPIGGLLWTAPELLRMENRPAGGTQPGDVYSFAIVVQEIIARDVPFGAFHKTPQEIINLVRAGLAPPFRPELPNINAADLDPGMVTLMKDCWAEDPKARPVIGHVKRAVKQIGRGKEGSLLDHALKMMDKYSSSLEATIADRTRQLTEETKKADILLYKFLPKPVADRLKSGCSVDPEAYDSVTILFSDVADFDAIAAKSSPLQLCSLLNDIYYTLDEIIDDYNVFKVQTINDVYMMASGLKTGKENELPPTRHGIKASAEACGKMHVAVAANLALHIQLTMANYIIPHLPKEKMKIRMGIHTGPAISGVIGSVSPQYCLFGDTVNIASKLLDFGKGSCIHISESTNTYLTEIIGGFLTKPRGEIEVKGTGTFFTFWLLGKKVKSIEDKTNISADEDLVGTGQHGESGVGEHSLND